MGFSNEVKMKFLLSGSNKLTTSSGVINQNVLHLEFLYYPAIYFCPFEPQKFYFWEIAIWSAKNGKLKENKKGINRRLNLNN